MFLQSIELAGLLERHTIKYVYTRTISNIWWPATTFRGSKCSIFKITQNIFIKIYGTFVNRLKIYNLRFLKNITFAVIIIAANKIAGYNTADVSNFKQQIYDTSFLKLHLQR